jgi:hypothetical protein
MSEKGTIGWAVEQMLDGDRVRRAGWNGKGMWIALQEPDENSRMTRSQTDLLATDWEDAYA